MDFNLLQKFILLHKLLSLTIEGHYYELNFSLNKIISYMTSALKCYLTWRFGILNFRVFEWQIYAFISCLTFYDPGSHRWSWQNLFLPLESFFIFRWFWELVWALSWVTVASVVAGSRSKFNLCQFKRILSTSPSSPQFSFSPPPWIFSFPTKTDHFMVFLCGIQKV
jgi:hypothetical protein